VQTEDDELDQAQSLIVALRKALSPLESVASSKPHDFAELAHRHREVLMHCRAIRTALLSFSRTARDPQLAAAFDDLLAEQKPSAVGPARRLS